MGVAKWWGWVWLSGGGDGCGKWWGVGVAKCSILVSRKMRYKRQPRLINIWGNIFVVN
jgi:hypothetical protein